MVNSHIKYKKYIFVDSELQTYTKQSLERMWRNNLSNDWMSRDKASSFPVDRFYVNLMWTKTVKGVLKNEKQELSSIFEILQTTERKAINILVEGIKDCSLFPH